MVTEPEVVVRAALAAAGLDPPADEVAELVERYPVLRGLLEGFEEFDDIDETAPTLVYDPRRL